MTDAFTTGPADREPTERSAPADVPVHPLIRDRWSPRAYSPKPVDAQDLTRLFEAARWAPSNGNSQPWRYLITYRGEPAHARLLATLNERNQVWAAAAPVLAVAYACTVFPAADGKPARENPTAAHDLGLANATLALQATALELSVHFMAGYDAQALTEAFPPPRDVLPVTVFTIGHRAHPDTLPPPLNERERAPRVRRPREEFVVVDAWDTLT